MLHEDADRGGDVQVEWPVSHTLVEGRVGYVVGSSQSPFGDTALHAQRADGRDKLAR